MVYDDAKETQEKFIDYIGIEEGDDPCSYDEIMILFYEAIKQGDYKAALHGHRKLVEMEETAIDEIVFNANKHKFNSENVRLGSKNFKAFNKERKFVLKQAMICDATVGYWKLSK